MKKISIIIMVLVVTLASCKKTPEVNLKYVDVERDLVTVGTTTANIQCDYAYIATLKKAYLYYGEGENETNMTSAEMRVVQNTLYVELTGLKENTTYSYYYEFHNGFNSMRTALKSFKTSSGNGGGDEPPTPPSGIPEGAINGLFTINGNGDQVYFSKGNLQYQASTKTWKFAENQWDYMGYLNNNISSTYNGWIDLFGWGTSGWNSGNTLYHPWDSENSNSTLYGPPGLYNLNGYYANADWGVYNSISNGGNHANLWRVLTHEEWSYVLYNRNTSSGIRFAKATVNDVIGIVLIPDEWEVSFYELNDTNQNESNFSSNVFSPSQWTIMEQDGAAFLPAAGGRNGTWVGFVGFFGHYWTGECYDIENAWFVDFYDSGFYGNTTLNVEAHFSRFEGCSVRLVQDANSQNKAK